MIIAATYRAAHTGELGQKYHGLLAETYQSLKRMMSAKTACLKPLFEKQQFPIIREWAIYCRDIQ
jgi:hypothetical protein